MSEEDTTAKIKMPDTSHLIVSSSPHYHSKLTVRKIMLWVIVALLPSAIMGIYYFGWPAARTLGVCLVACVAFEALFASWMKRPLEIDDCSALVTGLLLGMNLPPECPLWVSLVGSGIAMGLGKMIYGGIGCNPFNPALVGRVALLIAMPQCMNQWLFPKDSVALATGATTQATPLQVLEALVKKPNAEGDLVASLNPHCWHELLTGCTGGSIGETCAITLLIGGLLLIYLKLIRWQIPVFYLGTVAVITGIARMAHPATSAPVYYHLLSGGLMLGAFFMATDMVTTPLSRLGAIIFAIGCGIITSAIRLWGSYPEGVSFSILFMNALTPLIDRYTAGKPFGTPSSSKRRGLKLDEKGVEKK